MAAETKPKIAVEDYKDAEATPAPTKAPSDFVLLKRIERDIAQLSEAGLAYLHVMLGHGKEP